MKSIRWNSATSEEQNSVLARPAVVSDPALEQTIADIFTQVGDNGDEAVRDLRRKYDRLDNRKLELEIPGERGSGSELSDKSRRAITTAATNIRKFHEAQRQLPIEVETMPGVLCRQVQVPLETVGIYVPGGTAPLVSTLLMTVIPAQVAGVANICLMTPPGNSASVDAAIICTCRLLGIRRIYAVGGPTAIAAMAFGTETIPRVDKVFGPGNAYVDAAKRHAAALPGGPAIDLPAGPSEVMIIADDQANPEFVAADLLAQAEHDQYAQAILVTTSENLADRVCAEIERQKPSLSRKQIIETALTHARLILVESEQIAVDVANQYAPEHLILNLQNPDAVLPAVRNAGAVFVGGWSPEAAGDYASGANHVLPTGGSARAYSGLSLAAFTRTMTVQTLSADGLRTLASSITEIAALEGLDAHARSVERRLEWLEREGQAA